VRVLLHPGQRFVQSGRDLILLDAAEWTGGELDRVPPRSGLAEVLAPQRHIDPDHDGILPAGDVVDPEHRGPAKNAAPPRGQLQAEQEVHAVRFDVIVGTE